MPKTAPSTARRARRARRRCTVIEFAKSLGVLARDSITVMPRSRAIAGAFTLLTPRLEERGSSSPCSTARRDRPHVELGRPRRAYSIAISRRRLGRRAAPGSGRASRRARGRAQHRAASRGDRRHVDRVLDRRRAAGSRRPARRSRSRRSPAPRPSTRRGAACRSRAASASSGWSGGGGSSSKTSSAAPATWPERERLGERRLVDDAAARAVHDPHALLHLRERRRGRSSPRVSGVSGVCTVMKSARAKSSSSDTSSTPRRAAASAVTNGS